MSENISEIDYRQVAEYALEPLIIHSDLKIIYINQAAEKFFRADREEVVGASPLDIFQETSKSAIDNRIQSAYEQPANVIEETIYRMDRTTVDVELYCHPVMIGDTKAIQTYVRDITEKRQAEKKQKEITKEINVLSSTLVPLFDGMAILPLTGAIDEERALHLLDKVPENIMEQNIESVILDFSGTYSLDSLVLDYIFRINRVLSVMGVHYIITGLRPELAMQAVDLDMELHSPMIALNVKEAIKKLSEHAA
ncbi:PAS domain S-box protein [Virgibacillus xinjiangensis]|uniref:PAS domain S-box protein n=1 Tax=Virgibacillus xinjiangensis TaxID=393090 RepID=A0ABV7CTN3_9BACI